MSRRNVFILSVLVLGLTLSCGIAVKRVVEIEKAYAAMDRV